MTVDIVELLIYSSYTLHDVSLNFHPTRQTTRLKFNYAILSPLFQFWIFSLLIYLSIKQVLTLDNPLNILLCIINTDVVPIISLKLDKIKYDIPEGELIYV